MYVKYCVKFCCLFFAKKGLRKIILFSVFFEICLDDNVFFLSTFIDQRVTFIDPLLRPGRCRISLKDVAVSE
jgi:hypothetical protein